jgi:drug/metabolite transporter (DMT)-like permease
VVVVLQRPGIAWPVPESLADWLALAGGFSFALTNVMLRKLGEVDPPSRIFAMFAGGAALAGATALAAAHAGIVPALPPARWAWLLLAAALSLGFLSGNMALQYGAARLDAHASALIMLAEVVFASFSSVALGAATLAPGTLAGGGMIIAAAAWSALPSTRKMAA